MRKTKTLISALVALGLLLSVPSTIAQGTQGVTGIELQSVPNAVAVSWQAPPGISVDRYTVYYAHQSILQNNGRFDDKEMTFGPETSLVLLDLKNRGFTDGEMIHVTVTYTDLSGQENPTFAEEKSVKVRVPGTTSAEPHESAPPPGTTPGTVVLENAVAENLTTVRLHFSSPVRIPEGVASPYFSIAGEQTGNPVAVLSAVAEGQDIVLTTLTMNPRTRYTVSVSNQVAIGTATFVARGEEITMPQGGPEPGGEIRVPPLLEIHPEIIDRTPPEPPRDLILKKALQENGLYRVEASWRESLNTAQDLQSYNVYESGELGKTFVGPTALRATVLSTTIADVPPGTLTMKITAMDRNGNESGGVQETIILPETGPALTLLLSIAGAGLWTVRRQKRSRM